MQINVIDFYATSNFAVSLLGSRLVASTSHEFVSAQGHHRDVRLGQTRPSWPTPQPRALPLLPQDRTQIQGFDSDAVCQ
jgi:hypothetical protein